MITQITGTCSFQGCEAVATHISARDYVPYTPDKYPIPACYCEAHAHEVVDEPSPEYKVECPNCRCMFGVG